MFNYQLPAAMAHLLEHLTADDGVHSAHLSLSKSSVLEKDMSQPEVEHLPVTNAQSVYVGLPR